MSYSRVLAAFVLLALSVVAGARAVTNDSDIDSSPEVLPETLVPKDPVSEEERDRLEAQSLFATARMLEQKEDFAAALRMYQRAFRCDPQALPIAREIVPLAFTLGRSAEAVRYALKTAELDPSDSALLQRLAAHLTTQGEFERAVKLYEMSQQASAKPKNDADAILMAAQIAKLHVAVGQLPEAAKAYRQVLTALASDQSDLDSRTRRVIVEDSSKTLELLGASLGGRSKEGATFDLLGLVMLEGDDLEGAEQAFGKAQQASPREAIDAYQHAQLLAKKGDWKPALESLEIYLKANETARGSGPYELLKTVLAALSIENESLSRLEAHRRDDPPNAPLDLFLAEQYRATEQWQNAAALYEKTLAAAPSLEAYRGSIESLRRTQNFKQLSTVLAKALGDVRTTELLGDEGKSLLADSKAVDQSIEHALGEPLTADQLAGLGQFAIEANRLEAATKLFDKALEAEGADRNQIFRRWGLGLLLEDHYDESVLVLERALKEEAPPTAKAELEFHLAGSLEMGGHTDQALAAANRALELATPHAAEMASSYHRIASRPAWVLYHAKRYTEAETAYKALVDKFSNDYEDEELRETLRDAKLMLSNIAVIQGRMPEAEEWLEQILDEFPDDVSAHNDLGYLWADQNKRLKRALVMIETAVASAPENAAYLDSLGWVLYRLGRYDQAAEKLEAAVAKEADADGVMLDHLGDVYLAGGKLEQARSAWTRAVAAFEKAGEVNKMKPVQKKLEQGHPEASRSLRRSTIPA